MHSYNAAIYAMFGLRAISRLETIKDN